MDWQIVLFFFTDMDLEQSMLKYLVMYPGNLKENVLLLGAFNNS